MFCRLINFRILFFGTKPDCTTFLSPLTDKPLGQQFFPCPKRFLVEIRENGRMRHKCTLITGFFALILLVLGILLLSVFPLVAFPKLVKSQLQLKQEEDGSLPKSTFYWANPPAQVYLQFTMFDVINDEDVLFHGRKPIVVERGPYAFR